jgi:hypothetical protein
MPQAAPARLRIGSGSGTVRRQPAHRARIDAMLAATARPPRDPRGRDDVRHRGVRAVSSTCRPRRGRRNLPRRREILLQAASRAGHGSMEDMAATHATRFTAKEYLALEAVAEVRHEFTGGLIVAMAGTELEHNQIAPRTCAAS